MGSESQFDGLPGFHQIVFPDFTLVVDKEFVPIVELLRDFLNTLLHGEIRSPELEPFASGRGSVYIVRSERIGELVVRPYRHGGFLGGILKTRFFTPRRFIRELVLTVKAHEFGITRLVPVGVAFRRLVCGVQGFWISRHLAGWETLHTHMESHPPTRILIGKVAQAVAQMHQMGIAHVDLTIQNILLKHKLESHFEVSIIDFDRAYYRDSLELRECAKQLRRLDRSLLKWLPERSPWRKPVTRLRFAAAYCRLLPQVRPMIKGYIQGFENYKRGYRLGWGLQTLIGRIMGHSQ